MMSRKLFYLRILLITILIKNGLFSSGYKQYEKDKWLKNLLSRTKRSIDGYYSMTHKDLFFGQSAKEINKQRPCPDKCNCNYDTINCNELIDSCTECVHWNQIDFNQILQMKTESFKNFRFAPNRTTHIIIYKLLNSTIGADTFKSLIVPTNSRVEITFQYNSVIKFDKNALSQALLESNSTLVFNFPYTTQVLFNTKCFEDIQMKDQNSRLILRILKSFSVKFFNDFFPSVKAARAGSRSTSDETPNHQKNMLNSNKNMNSNTSWRLTTGQIIVDIKLTHMVEFYENSFAHLKLNSNAKFILDLEIIEKLLIQRHAFSHLSLDSNSNFIFYSKHVTFIDIKAFSFSHIHLVRNCRAEIYLEELTSSLCLQRNVFSHLKLLHENAHFNFSIINSKNVMFMHDSFSNILINNKNSRLYIGIYNSPSYMLTLKKNNYYQAFLVERLKYLWPLNNHQQQSNNYHLSPPFQLNNEYFYNHLTSGLTNVVSLNNRLTGSKNQNNYDFKTFYINNLQTYSYNLSIERNTFSHMNITESKNDDNFWLIVDNVNSLLVDDFVFNNSGFKSVNFIVNVRHLAMGKSSLQNIKNVRIEFLNAPKVLKLGLTQSLNKNFNRVIKLIGLNLNNTKKVVENSEFQLFNKSSDSGGDDTVYDYLSEQDNVDFAGDKIIDSHYDYRRKLLNQVTIIDDYCQISSLPSSDTVIHLESRSATHGDYCSCQSLYLVMNQIKSFQYIDYLRDSNILNCKLQNETFFENCAKSLQEKCQEKKTEDNSNVEGIGNNEQANNKDTFLSDYVKFWSYCISETDSSMHSGFLNGKSSPSRLSRVSLNRP